MAETKYYNKDWKEIKRQVCQIFTRVMGYLRPVSHYNIWKKTEFYSRKYFVNWCSCNREFTERYAVVEGSNTTLTIN